ncbi:FMN-dependent NADH-azoreductase [Alishewanella longhuensis]|uniref:FMN dependent NADH:quinone oxidoreductase n=1 Tax=Alishewanella longhuensis TaxID=1091037 RepID=A0ABQ3KXH5_9ALTE|nr:NAD(P)H-dependent oxidoreductase [Alishewanella longhuensis]GHG68199.1 FMN-dependent NADH-azoreductase [Alishewanella longhuensis]
MKNVLVIKSSISGDNGKSNQLIAHLLAQGAATNVSVTEIDLNLNPLPHLEMSEIASWMTAAADRTAEQQALAAHSDDLIAKVTAADALVIGVPMYNFALPSQLKALFDRLARAGVTFKYTEQGPVGLLADKPVVFALARGGIYANSPADSQVPFLKSFFNFIGLTQLHYVYAEGLNMGPESAENALSKAQAELSEIAKILFA